MSNTRKPYVLHAFGTSSEGPTQRTPIQGFPRHTPWPALSPEPRALSLNLAALSFSQGVRILEFRADNIEVLIIRPTNRNRHVTKHHYLYALRYLDVTKHHYLHAFRYLDVTKHQYFHAFLEIHLDVTKHKYLHAF